MFELDTTQRRAVESNEKTIIISGGPGTGKTSLIMQRFKHLVKSLGIPASSILVLSFSGASCMRLRRSIEDMLSQSYDELWIHTCHSFANRVLAEYCSASSELPAASSIPPFREYLVVKELLRAQRSSLKSSLKNIALKDGLARQLSDFFGLLKQNLVWPEDFQSISRGGPPELSDMARMYASYENHKIEKNWVGLRDVIADTLRAFEKCGELLEHYLNGFTHILIDEFEEIDPAQFSLVKALASEETSLFLAGDEDQRIFRFRGSMIDQFSEIGRDGRNPCTFNLTENYRLPSQHQAASRNLIEHNRGAKRKTSLLTADDTLSVLKFGDPIEQAYAVARDIKSIFLDSHDLSQYISYSDFAVICRSTSRSSLALEEALSYFEIPYILYNSTSFHKHPMVRCIADFIRLLEDPSDSATLLRVLHAPSFGLNAIELGRIAGRVSDKHTDNLYEFIRKSVFDGSAVEKLGIRDKQTALALKKFVLYFDGLRQRAHDTECPAALIHSLMEKMFFGEIIAEKDTATGVRDARSLRLLYEVVTDIEKVFTNMHGRCGLAEIAQYMEHAFTHFSSQQESNPVDESNDGVKIMTVHQAKGLEFPFVYLVDMTDEFYPSFGGGRCMLNGKALRHLVGGIKENNKGRSRPCCTAQFGMTVSEQLREERQLVYVAATRASQRLTLCFTEESHSSDQAMPSPFIEELTGTMYETPSHDGGGAAFSSNALPLLASALNKQEIESALRNNIQSLGRDGVNIEELTTFFESLDLDARFICHPAPFECEPQQAPILAGHRYSASQLATYLTCPRRFFFEKVLRITPERPEDFGLGQLVHLVLEKFHTEVKQFDTDLSILRLTLKKTFNEVWHGQAFEDNHSGQEAFCFQFPTALQQAAIKRLAEDILDRYLATEIAQTGERKIVACEEFIEFAVGGYPFVARIDRIDVETGGHSIIDYKTSRGGGPKGAKTIKKKFLNIDGKADYVPEDFQLPLYALAGRSAGYEAIALVYYWLAEEDSRGMFKKSSIRVDECGADCLSAEDLNEVESSVVEIVKKIAAGNFNARPKSSFDCKRCAFDSICILDNEDMRTNVE